MTKESSNGELPKDRGWSWVVCFASFICMFVIGTAMQALSVLFLELVSEFGSSFTVTSLTVMCFVMSLSVSSVVSTSVLVPRFGERLVIVVAGALFSACSIGYYFAPNIFVFIAFAGGKGTCVGLIFVPSVSLLSYYFDKRRSLATTISNSGVCVAGIVAPPFIRFITDEYGMRGAFLILSAFELHMVAAGILMRPVSSYRSVPREDTGMTVLEDNDAVVTKEKLLSEIQTGKSGTDVDAEVQQKLLPASLNHNIQSEKVTNSDDSITKHSNGRLYDRATSQCSDVILERSEDHELSEEPLSCEKPESNSNTEPVSSQYIKRLPVTRQTSKKELLKRQTSRKDSIGQNSYHGSNWSINQKYPGHSLHRGSIMSVTSGLEPAITGVGLGGRSRGDSTEADRGWRSCCFISVVRQIFDPVLFRQLAFRVFLISAIPSATSQYLLQYVPTIARFKGATEDQSATLLTIVGSVDLVSRMAVGFFADTHVLRSTQIVAISQICQGILLQFNPLFDTFEKLIAMVVIMGLFIGTRQSLIPMMHVEIVGMELMARCLSITAMLATISAATHSPMLGAILEATGTYDVVLHYIGVALIVGAVIMLFMPLLSRVDARRETTKMAA